MTEVILWNFNELLRLIGLLRVAPVQVESHFKVGIIVLIDSAQAQLVITCMHALKPILFLGQTRIIPAILGNTLPHAHRICLRPTVKAVLIDGAFFMVAQYPPVCRNI